MSKESCEERRTPPARLDHKFQQPIVEELPQQKPQSVPERIDATREDISGISDANDDAL